MKATHTQLNPSLLLLLQVNFCRDLYDDFANGNAESSEDEDEHFFVDNKRQQLSPSSPSPAVSRQRSESHDKSSFDMPNTNYKAPHER